MANRDILIISSDTATGLLTLSDSGNTHAKKKDNITWKTRPGSQVASFRIEEKKNSDDIWSKPPYPQGSHWAGEISGTAPDYATYRYSIYWRRTAGGDEFHHDPIISIRPSVHDEFTILIVTILAAILAFLGIKFLFGKKKKK